MSILPTSGPLVRVLLIREDGGITAQMLEMDFAARGATEDEALRCLARTVRGQARLDQTYGRQPLEGVKPAPAKYWDRWRALELGAPIQAEQSSIPPAYIIHAAVKSESYQLSW